MNEKDITHLIFTAVSYYLFSNEFFNFSAEIKGKQISSSSRFLCFASIYIWFIIASYLELPLIINWLIFLTLLGMEVHIVFSFDFVVSYALSMFCAIMSLAVNVFFRSLFSIFLQVPLNSFDNTMSYLKMYPIFLGFIVMALLFYILRHTRFSSQLERLMHYRKSLAFYTYTEIFIYLFLMVQLLVFSQSGNEMGIKIWGIKSALFSAIVLVIAIIYSLRVASLYHYMFKKHEVHDRLIQEKQDINKLWALAYTDILTGQNNRQLLDIRLEEYCGYGSNVTLAFIDVNGLKIINDQYGHMEGDNYLLSVSQTLSEITSGLNIDLFRYGGDEFVMMSTSLSVNEISHLLDKANERLSSISALYSQSISYGTVHGSCTDYQKLIDDADALMYKHKLKHYENMVRT